MIAVWEMGSPPEGGWTVGDPIPLRLRVTHPPGLKIALPELPGQWGPFEVRQQKLQAPTPVEHGATNTVREASVVLWAPGEYETPPLAISYQEAGGEVAELPVPPLSITVASVLAEDDVEKRDLKPQASLPRPPVWPWLLASALALAMLILAGRWLWWRWPGRKRGAAEALEAIDTRPPEEIAYNELDRIAGLDLPARGEFKPHYTLATDCIRTYLEGIYPVSAMDRTTNELIFDLRRARVAGDTIALVRGLLDEADLVKFAKFRPAIGPARAAVTQARHIVDITRPDRAATGESPAPG